MPPLAETGLLSRFDGLYRKGRSSCVPLLVMRWDRMTQSTGVWLHAKRRPEFKVLLTAFGVFMAVSGAAFPVRRPDIYTSCGAIPCSSSLGLGGVEDHRMLQISKSAVDFIVPVKNETACIDEFMRRLISLRETVSSEMDLRAIFIDDGSDDDSLAKLVSYAERLPFVRVVALSRNFGHQYAVTAGLDLTRADYCCIIDSDLQDPRPRPQHRLRPAAGTSW
jgi:hypothetical protein